MGTFGFIDAAFAFIDMAAFGFIDASAGPDLASTDAADRLPDGDTGTH